MITNNLKKSMFIVFFTLIFSIKPLFAFVVDINAKINNNDNPVEIFLDAGTYQVDVIGPDEGGAFNGWSAWSFTNCSNPSGCVNTRPTTNTGILNTYQVLSSDIASVSVDGIDLVPVSVKVTTGPKISFFLVSPSETFYRVDDGFVYPDGASALSQSVSSVFTLSASGSVGFSIYDSTSALGDNRGGVSLNVTLAPVLSAVEAFVTRFYWECLGRKPDPKGLNDWTNGLTDGVHTGADVARHFINSTEFQGKNHSNEKYLEILYKAFFDRPADTAGKNFWLGELNAGKKRGYVLDGFLRSQEFYDLCWKYGIFPHSAAAFVYRFYDECLGREPDRKGLEDWTKGLLDGVHTGADVARHFINSYEFQSKNFSDAEYIVILYWAFFNRAPDQAGENFWLGELKAGKDRGYVLDGFLKSDEFSKLCEDYGITPY
jgi:hypothetical protein